MSVVVSNCCNGELVIHAPQETLDKLIAHIEQSGGTVQRGGEKPEPIPATAWNWSGEAEFAKAVARSVDADKPTPIPIRAMEFSSPSREPELVLN